MHGAEKRPHTPTLHSPPLPGPHHRATPTLPQPSPLLAGSSYNFSTTRSFALRDRGFRFTSSSEAVTGRPVRMFTISFAPHAHTGKPGGHVHSPFNRRKARLTMRSSSEWNEMMAMR